MSTTQGGIVGHPEQESAAMATNDTSSSSQRRRRRSKTQTHSTESPDNGGMEGVTADMSDLRISSNYKACASSGGGGPEVGRAASEDQPPRSSRPQDPSQLATSGSIAPENGSQFKSGGGGGKMSVEAASLSSRTSAARQPDRHRKAWEAKGGGQDSGGHTARKGGADTSRPITPRGHKTGAGGIQEESVMEGPPRQRGAGAGDREGDKGDAEASQREGERGRRKRRGDKGEQGRAGAGGAQGGSQLPSVVLHDDLAMLGVHRGEQVMVHVPGCNCKHIQVFRHCQAWATRQAYLVLKEKAGGQGHTHAFAFPSPQHSLDTEKALAALLAPCSYRIKLGPCSRLHSYGPSFPFHHGAALLLGEYAALEALAIEYGTQETAPGQGGAGVSDRAAIVVPIAVPQGQQRLTKTQAEGAVAHLKHHPHIQGTGVGLSVGHHLVYALQHLHLARLHKAVTPPLQRPALLAMVQSWPDTNQADIFGGKRMLGEVSTQATVREVDEESGGLVDVREAQHWTRVAALDLHDHAMAFHAYLYTPSHATQRPGIAAPAPLLGGSGGAWG